MPGRPVPTHFLCIPLAAPQLSRTLSIFKSDVTSPSSFDLPEQAVRPPGTLHLTLGVMTLKDEAVTQASDFVRQIRLKDVLDQARAATVAAASPAARAMGLSAPSAEGDKSLSITLRGLATMQKPAQASVLYAPPEDSTGLLRQFCEVLRKAFIEAGHMTEETRPLLLHATLVNTIYVKGRGRKTKLTIDARDIIRRYDDFVWLEGMKVDGVNLCRMGAKEVEGSDGDQAYEVEARVEFGGS